MDTLEHNDAHKDYIQEQINAAKINLSGSVLFDTGGANLHAKRTSDGNQGLIPTVPYTDLEGANSCIAPYVSELLVGVPIQNDDQGEVTGNDIRFYPTEDSGSIGTMTYKYYAKSGSTIPTTDVTFRLYRGTSAGDMINENLMFEGLLPKELWLGNFQENSFTIKDVATGVFTGREYIEFVKGQKVIIQYISATPLSLRTKSDQSIQYYRADIHTVTDRKLLDEFTTRSPYIGLDFTAGTFALVTGDNIITNWVVGESNYFDYDSVTGYYAYTGQDMPFFRASTEFGGVSNTPNCFVQMAIDIDRGGVVTRKLGMPREFDGTNAGSLSYTSRAYLENGDKIRVVAISSKDAPTFEVTYLGKFVEKVS